LVDPLVEITRSSPETMDEQADDKHHGEEQSAQRKPWRLPEPMDGLTLGVGKMVLCIRAR
jgi:hypothetical protein